MKVDYGSSIPPGLAAPTRGEIRIRVEMLQLHPELIKEADPTAEVPIDDCALCVQWWGEPHPNVVCTPSTPSKTRETSVLVFPLKAPAEQVGQYLHHMSHATQGVHLRTVVPPKHTGKRKPIPVGTTKVRLDSLTPSTPVGGWFDVFDEEANKCIGRLRVTCTVQYFVPKPEGKENAPQTKKSKSAKEPAQEEGAAEQKPSSSQEPENTAVEVLPPPTNTKPAAVSDSSKPSVTSTSSSSVTPAVGSVSPSTAAPTPQPRQETSSAPAQDNKSSGAVVAEKHVDPANQAGDVVSAAPTTTAPDQQAMREIFIRGLQLRDRMAEASGRSGASSSGAIVASSGQGLGVARPAGPQHVKIIHPMPSGREHLHKPAPMSDDDAEDLLSDVTDEDLDDEIFAAKQRQVKAEEAQQPVQIHHFHEPQTVTVSLHTPTFAGNWGVQEVRVLLRVSKDVTSQRPFNEVSSGIFEVPVLQQINLTFPVDSYTSDSRIVLEMESITSQETDQMLTSVTGEQRPMKAVVNRRLLGVVIVGLYTQAPRHVFFHDPITGENPAQAVVGVAVDARSGSNNGAAAQQLALTNGEAETKVAPSLVDSDGFVRTPKSTASPLIDSKEAKKETDRERKNRRSNKRSSRHHRRKYGSSRRYSSSDSSSSCSSYTSSSSSSSSDSDGDGAAMSQQQVIVATMPANPKRTALQLHVRIAEAKHLPLIAKSENGIDGPFGATETPNVFVVLEDVLYRSNVSPQRPEPASDIACTNVTNGTGDRTKVQRGVSPRFDYSCVVQVNDVGSAQSLASVRFGIYHRAEGPTAVSSRPKGAQTTKAASLLEEEERFWAGAQQLGVVEISLQSLRYLPRGLDGWHHILSTNHAVPTHVGQVHLAVAVLPAAGTPSS